MLSARLLLNIWSFPFYCNHLNWCGFVMVWMMFMFRLRKIRGPPRKNLKKKNVFWIYSNLTIVNKYLEIQLIVFHPVDIVLFFCKRRFTLFVPKWFDGNGAATALWMNAPRYKQLPIRINKRMPQFNDGVLKWRY